MTNINLGTDVKVTVMSNAVAAGTSDVEPTTIDMQDFESVMFIVTFGAIVAGAATTVKAQQSAASGSGEADLLGTSQTVADDDDNQAFVIDLVRPGKRYVRPVVTRATQNSTVESIIAIQYNTRKSPTTQDATTVGGIETHVSPAEGTA